MPLFRKKPVEIEAVQFDGCLWQDEDTWSPMFAGSFDIRPDWLTEALAKPKEVGAAYPTGLSDPSLTIVTLEGLITASPGDWIIKGTDGELYPCKPHIFPDIYEPVTIGRTELSGGGDA